MYKRVKRKYVITINVDMCIKWAQKKFIVIIVVDKKNDHINKFTLIFKIKFVDHLF